MKLYTVSYFSNGERIATDVDGVYDVVSSLTNAYRCVQQYIKDYNELITDFEGDMTSCKIYTDKGMYLIECFILDDDIEEEEEDEEEDFEDDDYDEVEEEDEEEDCDINDEDYYVAEDGTRFYDPCGVITRLMNYIKER